MRAGLAAVACVGAYAPFFGRRNDYPGHFIAGLGGTLLVLSLVGALSRRPLREWAVGAMWAAIAMGALTEATVFRLAIFDPVDFVNQSLGATVAAAAVVGFPLVGRSAALAILLSFGCLVAGFGLAFS